MKAPIGRELAPVSCSLLLRLFPFGVVVNKDMCILGVGGKLLQAWGNSSSILDKHVSEIFKLRRPKGITFSWGNVRYLSSFKSSVRWVICAWNISPRWECTHCNFQHVLYINHLIRSKRQCEISDEMILTLQIKWKILHLYTDYMNIRINKSYNYYYRQFAHVDKIEKASFNSSSVYFFF